ncbi:MAG: Metal-dependent phosphohydrolase, subdomain protein [Moraxellaceae bacterium]|nr:Metal-dependent phosphohydrolase, subdomain protein [Moraxellaceae bacterium]
MSEDNEKNKDISSGATNEAGSHDYFVDSTYKKNLQTMLLEKECLEKSQRFGISRRHFLTSSFGAVAAASIFGQIAGFSSKAEAMDGFVSPSEDLYKSVAETTSFTRLDQSTAADWMIIENSVRAQGEGVVDTIKNMINASRGYHLGFGPDQFTHITQAATRAKRDNASDEMILVCLVHDLAKVISNLAHADIIAGIVRPYVSDGSFYLLRHHMEYQWKHYGTYVLRPTNGRARYVGQPWHANAVRFSDEYDQKAFDPYYRTDPIEAFLPLVEQFFGTATPRNNLTHQICIG